MAKPLVHFQAKVTPETFEALEAAQQEGDFLTKNQFLETVIESYLNPKTVTKEVLPVAAAEEIQYLKNKIGQLETAATLKDEEHTKLESEFCRLVESQGVTPGPDQLILTLKPEIFAVLQKERDQAKRKTGKEYTDNDIVNLHFWNMYRSGVTYPLFTWDESDRVNFKKQQIKEAQNVGNPE